MHQLTVLYDAHCEFCQRCRAWMESQPQYLALRFIARDSEVARRLYPQLTVDIADDELLAISDDGRVYRDAKAWLMCLYTLRNYRSLAMRLSRPGMQGLARRAFALVSHHRRRLPRWLLPARDDRLAARLREVRDPLRCATDPTTMQALRRVREMSSTAELGRQTAEP